MAKFKKFDPLDAPPGCFAIPQAKDEFCSGCYFSEGPESTRCKNERLDRPCTPSMRKDRQGAIFLPRLMRTRS